MDDKEKKYWLEWADRFIDEVEEETPENFTDEYRLKIAKFLRDMTKTLKY